MKNPIVQARKWLAHRKVKRSPFWPHTRRVHLAAEGWCRWCGAVSGLEVHHIVPFHRFPAWELDPANLITLCENVGKQCHLKRGHNGNWKNVNPDIRKVATFPKP